MGNETNRPETLDDFATEIATAQKHLNALLAQAAKNGISARVGKLTYGGSLTGREAGHEQVKITLEVAL